MTINIHLLKATGRLNTFTDLLRTVSNKAILEISQKLPVKDVDIVLFDNPEETIEHLGIGGYTPTAHLIYISLNPEKENFTKHINEDLPRTLAHELHHSLRWRNPGYGETLLEAMVTEGLADHFALEIKVGKPDLWDTALSEEQIYEYFRKAKEEYSSRNYNHREWFFGKGKIPHWAGYTLGFQLVKKYLQNHPGQKASMLYKTKAEEFL